MFTLQARMYLALTTIIIALLLVSPVCGQTVVNGSFEANSYAYPGYGSITGWACSVGTSGINSAAVYPFANNGAIPDGNNVAFVQVTGSATLTQDIVGLEAGKRYSLLYFENSRAEVTPAFLSVSIEDTIIDAEHVVNRVGNSGNWSVPYHSKAANFTVPADGTYTLSFNVSCPLDTALLLDNVQIVEALPLVTNGSFEANSHEYPGYGSITGWTCSTGTSGVNSATVYPFANNGAIPDGNNVAFVQVTGNATLTQDIAGLVDGTRYRLTYFENSRAEVLPATLSVSIGATTIVAEHVVNRVGDSGNFSVPYHDRTADFTVPADGAYTLSFNVSCVSDTALLLDKVVIEELSPYPAMDYSDNITVDGNLNDWADAAWRPFDTDYDKNPYADWDITEEGSQWAVKWGAGGTKLYIAAKVIDTAHSFTDAYEDWFVRDAVEMYIHTTGTNPASVDYSTYEEQAQQWTIGIMESNRNAVWRACGYPPIYATNVPPITYIADDADCFAAGREDGQSLYYEAAITAYDYFGGLKNSPSIISPLHADDEVQADVVAASSNGVDYVGMKSSGPTGGGWSSDYSRLAKFLLIRSGVKGTITLQDFGASTLLAGATVVITDASNASETHNVVLDGSGAFSFKTALTGPCTAVASAPGYASQSQSVVVTDGQGDVSFTLAKQTAEPVSITAAKKKTISSLVSLTGSITAVFAGNIYVEDGDRVSGIRVDKTDHGFASTDVGKVVTVTGAIKKDDSQEIYIQADQITASTDVNVIKPLGLTNKAAGGGDFVNTSGDGQVGVVDGTGLNNIGLLVRTTGSASAGDANGFTITDGSGVTVRVILAGAGSTYNTKYVTVTGISGIGANGVRTIKARAAADVQIVN